MSLKRAFAKCKALKEHKGLSKIGNSFREKLSSVNYKYDKVRIFFISPCLLLFCSVLVLILSSKEF